jgi:hypothetical protein
MGYLFLAGMNVWRSSLFFCAPPCGMTSVAFESVVKTVVPHPKQVFIQQKMAFLTYLTFCRHVPDGIANTFVPK